MADERSLPASACLVLFWCLGSTVLMCYTAPGTPSTHPFAESGMLPYGGDFVIMNRVQIAMARKVFGWPLYTIVIAIGQARVSLSSLETRVY